MTQESNEEAISKPVHSSSFKKRRAMNWLVLGTTYASMYMARYNFSFANKSLSETYGWDKTEIGAIISLGSLIYGISALVNGVVADKIGGRKSMLLGAFGAMFFNMMFGFGAYIGVFTTPTFLLGYLSSVWMLNMYFQSYSALSLIKVNSAWFHVSERGVFSAIFGSMIQSGRAAVYLLMMSAFVVALPWQWKFFLPSFIVFIMTVLTFLVVRDSPKDAQLEEFDTQDATSGDTEEISLSYVAKKVFRNPVAITIAVAEFCTGFVRKGFEEWFPRYMQEAQNLQLNDPVFQKNAFAVVFAGIVGAFIAGTLSDWFFQSRRAPVACIGYILQFICLGIIAKAPSLNLVVVAFVFNSLAISMSHSMLSGTASMDFGGKRAAATAAGMFDGMQYVGGAFTGIGMGYLLDVYGWSAWGPSMMGFSLTGAILMMFLWNAKPKRGASH